MAIQNINVDQPNSHQGDTLRDAFIKVNNNFAELQAEFDNYTDTDSLTTIIDGLENDLEALEALINTKANIVHTHTIAQIVGLVNALNGLVKTTTFNSAILGLNQQIILINTQIADLLLELHQTIDRVEVLEEGLEATNVSLSALTVTVSGHTSQLASIEAGQVVQNNQIAALSATTGVHTTQIASLSATSATHTGQIADINSNIDAIEGDVDGIQLDILDLQAVDADLQEQIDDLEAEQLIQNDEIDSLQDQIDNLPTPTLQSVMEEGSTATGLTGYTISTTNALAQITGTETSLDLRSQGTNIAIGASTGIQLNNQGRYLDMNSSGFELYNVGASLKLYDGDNGTTLHQQGAYLRLSPTGKGVELTAGGNSLILSKGDFINSVGFELLSRGQAIVSGTTNSGSSSIFRGLEYGEDYSSVYSDRSLVDKEYVDNLPTPTLQNVTTAGNTTDKGIVSTLAVGYALDAQASIKTQGFSYANTFEGTRVLFAGGGGAPAITSSNSQIDSNVAVKYLSGVTTTFTGREVPDVNFVQSMIDQIPAPISSDLQIVLDNGSVSEKNFVAENFPIPTNGTVKLNEEIDTEFQGLPLKSTNNQISVSLGGSEIGIDVKNDFNVNLSGVTMDCKVDIGDGASGNATLVSTTPAGFTSTTEEVSGPYTNSHQLKSTVTGIELSNFAYDADNDLLTENGNVKVESNQTTIFNQGRVVLDAPDIILQQDLDLDDSVTTGLARNSSNELVEFTIPTGGSIPSWNSTLGVDPVAVNKNILISGGSFTFQVGTTSLTLNANGIDTRRGNGANNTVLGLAALNSNINGGSNVAIGDLSSQSGTLGDCNTTVGVYSNWVGEGSNNTLLGFGAGLKLTTGSNNVIVGYQNVNSGGGGTAALTSGSNNVFISPLTYNGINTGSGNVVIGRANGLPSNSTNTVVISDGVGNQKLTFSTTGQATLVATPTTDETVTKVLARNSSGLIVEKTLSSGSTLQQVLTAGSIAGISGETQIISTGGLTFGTSGGIEISAGTDGLKFNSGINPSITFKTTGGTLNNYTRTLANANGREVLAIDGRTADAIGNVDLGFRMELVSIVGDGETQTFLFPHGIDGVPLVLGSRTGDDLAMPFTTEADDTNVIIKFPLLAPEDGYIIKITYLARKN